mmetsp:Transcript_31236/g.61846  ORF Transcript_31236/g.61846 Transcript_31236/m.61846 type:complete len:320 (+) Transcript_31236:71-1030(+)
MPTAPQIDCPQGSLFSLFGGDSEDENDVDNQTDCNFDQHYEVQKVDLAGEELLVRQYVFHSHNANRVWPGTFNLAEYIIGDEAKEGNLVAKMRRGASVLELGAATGLLAIRLAAAGVLAVTTSDVDDGHVDDGHGKSDDTVIENIEYNFYLNGFGRDDSIGTKRASLSTEQMEFRMKKKTAMVKKRTLLTDQSAAEANASDQFIPTPPHIPHTWGTGWTESMCCANQTVQIYDYIIASDILLYVTSYPALVKTLTELMKPSFGNKFNCVDDIQGNKIPKFIMSWNRRMKESAEFFKMMETAGFESVHEGKCVYTFSIRK